MFGSTEIESFEIFSKGLIVNFWPLMTAESKNLRVTRGRSTRNRRVRMSLDRWDDLFCEGEGGGEGFRVSQDGAA